MFAAWKREIVPFNIFHKYSVSSPRITGPSEFGVLVELYFLLQNTPNTSVPDVCRRQIVHPDVQITAIIYNVKMSMLQLQWSLHLLYSAVDRNELCVTHQRSTSRPSADCAFHRNCLAGGRLARDRASLSCSPIWKCPGVAQVLVRLRKL